MTLDYFYGQAGELFSFYRIPKALFQEPRFQNLSTDAKTLYGILLDRMSLSAKNGWLDEQGRVFIIFTIQEVRDATMYDELELDKLGDRKTALFLIMSDTDSTFNFLISMMVEILISFHLNDSFNNFLVDF